MPCMVGYEDAVIVYLIFILQAYFRKGCALYGLGRYEDAVVALLQCLALDSSISSARNYLSKVCFKFINIVMKLINVFSYVDNRHFFSFFIVGAVCYRTHIFQISLGMSNNSKYNVIFRLYNLSKRSKLSNFCCHPFIQQY